MKKVVLIVLVAFLLLLFIVLVVQIIQFTGKNILDNKNIAEKTALNKNEKSGKNGEVGGVESETARGSAGGGGGGDGGTGGGSGGGGAGGVGGTGQTISEESGTGNTKTQTCTEQQISYSIRNFIKFSVCNEYQENICIDKTLNCSLIVDNLDYEKSGDFEIKFSFLVESNEISSSSLNYFLNPQTSKVFEVIENIKSQGEAGNANREIFCSYNTIKIPQKERC